MNKKIFSLLVAVLIVCLMVTPLVMAKPGTDKSNPKFLDYILHVEFASASDIPKLTPNPLTRLALSKTPPAFVI